MPKILSACFLFTIGSVVPALVPCVSAQSAFVWAAQGGGAGADHGYSVATDSSGNVISTGFISSPSAAFNGVTLVPTGAASAFIAKHDRDGNLLFARIAGSMGDSEGVSVAVDPEGNILLGGVYSGYAVFGATTLSPGAGHGGRVYSQI